MGTRMESSSLLRRSLVAALAVAPFWAPPSGGATLTELYTVTVAPDPAASDQREAATQAARIDFFMVFPFVGPCVQRALREGDRARRVPAAQPGVTTGAWEAAAAGWPRSVGKSDPAGPPPLPPFPGW